MLRKMIKITIIEIIVITALIEITQSLLISKTQTKCESYDQKRCTKENKCDVEEVLCPNDSEKPHVTSSCYVVWSLDEIGAPGNISMKGCFTDNAECNQPECIARNIKPNGIIFCCCKGSFCNRNYTYIPTPTTPPTPKEPARDSNILYFLIASLTLVALIIFFCIGVCLYRRKKQGAFNEIPTVEPDLTNSSPNLAPRPIHLIEMKARGRFGSVWHGRLKNQEVAVKIFFSQERDSWNTELEIFRLPRMRHANILEFIAAEKHFDKIPQEYWLITAYHSHGSLCDYLKAHTVTWFELCNIAESMARGLMHLHEEMPSPNPDNYKPAVAHRDFKSKNVLLKSDLTACIADFGLAMIFQPGQPCGDTHGQVGTRRYMAPEVLEGAINFTRDAFLRIDVYACGLVLWEMVSRCTIHNGLVSEYTLPFETELGLHPTLNEMQENVVMKKLRPRICEIWRTHPGLSAICDTMEECWDHDAEARLSSSCVMERISQHTRYPTTPLLIETNTDTTFRDS